MPRDRYEDDDRDLPPPRKSAGAAPVVIILVVVAALLVVGALVCGGFFLLAWRATPEPNQAGEVGKIDEAVAKEGAKRTYTRDEFRQLVMGKTEQEVIDALGKPNVADDAPDSKLWIYRNRTTDPATGKTDPQVTVRLESGKVIAVDF